MCCSNVNVNSVYELSIVPEYRLWQSIPSYCYFFLTIVRYWKNINVHFKKNKHLNSYNASQLKSYDTNTFQTEPGISIIVDQYVYVLFLGETKFFRGQSSVQHFEHEIQLIHPSIHLVYCRWLPAREGKPFPLTSTEWELNPRFPALKSGGWTPIGPIRFGINHQRIECSSSPQLSKGNTAIAIATQVVSFMCAKRGFNHAREQDKTWQLL